MPGKEPLLTPAQLSAGLAALPAWRADGAWLERTYETDGWPFTLLVVGAIAFVAEAADHHPDLTVSWPRVVVRLQTHSAGGLTAKDLELARRIEESVAWKPAGGKKLVK
ncbi:MAG TPA: 4a-hydroxytetrahydrobiopterin dehydratase [Gemmatimonadales bacterium]|jgi:pterin-4a-carbinolamine dehydratase|nr:4a-hydroxytetrahydrobiopterin dehydratase [Gemmatimonadales bacterium]